MTRDVVIAGIAEAELANGHFAEPASVLEVQARCVSRALADAGLTLPDVDGVLVAGLWGMPGAGTLMPLTLPEYLGIKPRFVDGTNIGGSAFEAHVAHAAMAIERGYCDVAVITYGSDQRSAKGRSLAGRPPHLNMQFDTPFGLLTPIGSYALAAHRHMHEYGTTSEQLAEIAVSARNWAKKNPAAMKRDDLSVDDVLSSTMVSDPLHKFDACLVTDGGGAIVMTSPDKLSARAKQRSVYVRGYGEAVSHWTINGMTDLTTTSAAVSGPAAMSMAGVTHDDFDVVEIYDSFTITVLLTLEALGFCKRGEGGAFVENGRLGPGGEFPINTNGGGLSCSHPGMYGMFLLFEAVRQIRGDAGERQLPKATTALVNGTGGNLSSTATCVLSNR
ncbi:acetyl-CoA acetyltransferase [Salinisphaera aquimarina]|uniref:Acetyl-CoA acetyltransferase n=1 Tax=Salinisphaera aquimarina TaxID=2094031 RepID=A0ABV7EQ31_9GAMM